MHANGNVCNRSAFMQNNKSLADPHPWRRQTKDIRFIVVSEVEYAFQRKGWQASIRFVWEKGWRIIIVQEISKIFR